MPTAQPRVRRYGFHKPAATMNSNRPFSEMNITPLIDVLLVLLVMIMLSIPIALHKVEVDIPQGETTGEPKTIYSLHLEAAGNVLWNGEAIGDAELKTRLATLAKDPEKPQLHMRTDATTRYERFDQVIAEVKRAGVEEMGFVGNAQYQNWDAD